MTNSIYSESKDRRVAEPTKVADVKAETRIGVSIMVQTIIAAVIVGMSGIIVAGGSWFADKVLDSLNELNRNFTIVNANASARDARLDGIDDKFDTVIYQVNENSKYILKILSDDK